MKKLMIAAVAMAAGALFAEDITSKNIVGYMNNGEKTVKGLNLFGAGFQDVGYTSVKLNSLKVTNASGEMPGSDECDIQMIDANGVGVSKYWWGQIGRGAKAHWGWTDKSGEEVGDEVVFARGLGLLFTAENANDELRSNGDVDLSACTNGNTVAGLNIIANPYPTSVKVNTLKVTNAAGENPGSDECDFQTIDANGVGVAKYYWGQIGRGAKAHWGWTDKSGEEIGDDVTLAAGDAVLFTAQNAGDKLIFPAK